jgi:hypothetical protein
MSCKENPIVTLGVTLLATAGAIGIGMMVTAKGRALLKNLLNSAECCTDAAETAMRTIKSEMQDCFMAGEESSSCGTSSCN